MSITTQDLPELIELFSYGFAVGLAGGGVAFIISLLVNTFYGVAEG